MSKLGPITGLTLPLWMCITAHFLTDILSCHSLHHFSTDFNLSNKPLQSSFTSRVAYIFTSSANSLHAQLPSLNISMISLMNSTNSNGPITLPCTIPLHISSSSSSSSTSSSSSSGNGSGSGSEQYNDLSYALSLSIEHSATGPSSPSSSVLNCRFHLP